MILDKIDKRIIFDHSIVSYPMECCGILTAAAGEEADKWRVHKCTNIQDDLHRKDPGKFKRDARTAYFIDPREQIEVMIAAEREGRQIVGFYHSHIDTGAFFSETDEQNALFMGEPLFPGAIHIVVSIRHRAVKEWAVYRWNDAEKKIERAEFAVL